MYSYVAFGLSIKSEIALPELVAARHLPPDVTIRYGATHRAVPLQIPNEGYYQLDDNEEIYYYWSEVGAFLIRHGREVIIEPCAEVEERLIRLPLLGMVLAAVLYQRGFLALHASAVSLGGQAIAFLGDRGRGKSTTAAMMVNRGHRLIADDLAIIDLTADGQPLIYPGFPQLKLLPESDAASLPNQCGELIELADGCPKMGRRVPAAFATAPLPLKQLYLLEFGDALGVESLAAHHAVVRLVAQSYVARLFSGSANGRAVKTKNLYQCAELARRVEVDILRREWSLVSLPEIACVVESHLIGELDCIAA